MNVLLFGATGHTGRLLCKKLSAIGLNVIAAVRNAQSRNCSDLGVSRVIDVDLEGDFAELDIDADYVVFAAGSGSKTGPDKTLSVDLNGALKAIDWAARRPIKKFVMLSSMGCERSEVLPKELSTYLLAKAMADRRLQSSALEHLIVRPARLTFERAAGTISAEPTVDEFTPISREDVADIMVRLLVDRTVSNSIVDLMGGDTPINEALLTLTQREIVA